MIFTLNSISFVPVILIVGSLLISKLWELYTIECVYVFMSLFEVPIVEVLYSCIFDNKLDIPLYELVFKSLIITSNSFIHSFFPL